LQTKEKTHTRLTPIFRVAAFFFGLAFILVAGRIIARHQMQQSWLPVQAEVARVDINGWWNEAAGQRYYLEYRYSVNGRTHTGVRYHIKERSLKTYAGIEYQYKKGDAITVYYDPRDPGQAVLSTAYLRDEFAAMIILGGFLVLAGTVFIKETRERKLVNAIKNADDGKTALPDLPVIEDRQGILRLNTGMSLFWRVGMPFVVTCFAGTAPVLFLLEEINPGWGIERYMMMVSAVWIAGAIAGLLMTWGFSFALFVDRVKKEIREEIRFCFSLKSGVVAFSQISELRLYREKWRQDNPLRNWILFIQTTSGKSLTISRGFRDVQPADSIYLGAVKMRIEQLVFGSRTQGNE